MTIERSAGADATLLVGRLCLAALFLWSGLGKIGGFAGLVGMLTSQGVPLPPVAAVIAILLETGGAALVIVGFLTRPAAAGLIVFTVAATLIAHNFWAFEGADRPPQQIQFMKNLGLVGGFLVLVASGPGRYSVDGARGRLRDSSIGEARRA